MMKILALFAFATCQAYGDAEVVASPIAAVGSPIVTSRSSQYFAQNHNSLAAPIVTPVVPVAPIEPAGVEPVAKLTSPAILRSTVRTARLEAMAPVAGTARLEAVAPVAQVSPVTSFVSLSPQSASVSQFTRFAQYAAAPYFTASPFSVNTASLVINPGLAPLVARSPFPVPVAPLAQPVVPMQSVATQQPSENPAFQQPNPDSESVDIEAAKIRALPQSNVQENKAQVSKLEAQQNLARLRQQLRLQNERLIAGNSLPEPQRVETRSRPSKSNKVQESRSAAPGVFMSGQQQLSQDAYRY